MSKQTQYYKGIVRNVISGNSIIVQFLPEYNIPYKVISFEYLTAPRLGTPDGKLQDEPFGFESWDYLRNLCIGKGVVVSSRMHTLEKQYNSLFGVLNIAFAKVLFNDEDLGLKACRAGMVKLRESNQTSQENPYVAKLREAQEQAQNEKLGIWSDEQGTIRPLPVNFFDERLLSTREFDAIVDNVINGSVLSLFLLPNHEHILLQIAGCRAANFNKKEGDKSTPGYKAYQTIRQKFLNQQIRVRICQRQDKNQVSIQKTFIGCVIGAPDVAFQKLIASGLAQFYPKTSDFAPNANEYIVKEIVARSKKEGIWATIDAPLPPIKPYEFEGTVTSIHSSSSLFVTKDTETKLIFLNNLAIPYFYFNKSGGAEPYGFEAREFLRTHYVGQRVKVNVDGAYSSANTSPEFQSSYVREYATIFHNKSCINVDLVKNGLARYHDSYCDRNSHIQSQIKQADQEAKNRQIGLHSPTPIPAIEIHDLTKRNNRRDLMEAINQLRNNEHEGIIEFVASSSKFYVFIPKFGYLLRSEINGILPYQPNDKFAIEARNYCASHYTQSNVLITPTEVDKYGYFLSKIVIKTFYGKMFGLAEDLIKNGLAEIYNKFINTDSDDTTLLTLQRNACQSGVGVWSDKTRHDYELQANTVEKVKVISIWNPVKYSLQLLDHEMAQINKALSEQLVPINMPQDFPRLHNNDCIVAKYKDQFFRARIESFTTDKNFYQQQNDKKPNTPGINEVRLIDFDQIKNANEISQFYWLPEGLEKIKPQALTVKLAFLDVPQGKTEAQNNEAVDKLWSICHEVILYLHLVYTDGVYNVLLTDRPTNDSGSLNSLIIQSNYAVFVDHEAPPEFSIIKESLMPVEKPEAEAPPAEEGNKDQ